MDNLTTCNLHTQQHVGIAERIVMNLSQLLAFTAAIYSKLLGEEVTQRQALHALHAQLAFFVAGFTSCSLSLRFALMAWLAIALLMCKEAWREKTCTSYHDKS